MKTPQQAFDERFGASLSGMGASIENIYREGFEAGWNAALEASSAKGNHIEQLVADRIAYIQSVDGYPKIPSERCYPDYAKRDGLFESMMQLAAVIDDCMRADPNSNSDEQMAMLFVSMIEHAVVAAIWCGLGDKLGEASSAMHDRSADPIADRREKG